MINDFVQLQAVSNEDIEEINIWFNLKEYTKKNGIPHLLITKENLKRQVIDKGIMSKCPNLIIKNNGKPIGLIFYEIAKPMMSGVAISLYIFTENEYERLYMSGLIEYLKYAFDSVNYKRVTVYISQLVLQQNEKLDNFFKQLGFVKEGILKGERYVEGKYIDTHIWGILKEDFKCD